MSTVMVHPAIIGAGEVWRSRGALRKLVIQGEFKSILIEPSRHSTDTPGGFPVPNLTAPTPYSLTPAGTPATSPGPHSHFTGHFPGFATGLPSLSLTKPKVVDETKLKEREERKRLAEYSLKPKWEWAFGTWGVQQVWWTFAGMLFFYFLVLFHSLVVYKPFVALLIHRPILERRNRQGRVPAIRVSRQDLSLHLAQGVPRPPRPARVYKCPRRLSATGHCLLDRRQR